MKFSNKVWLRALSWALFLAIVSIGTALWAKAGDLDPSWDGDGIAMTQAGDGRGSAATSVLIQADGKVVAGGFATNGARSLDFLLGRYLPDGSLDASFGTNGVVLTDFPAGEGRRSTDYISDIILQADGKILAVGATSFSDELPISRSPFGEGDLNFALARYHPDGSLDQSFGNNGRVAYDFSRIGALDTIQSVVLSDQGRILVAGRTLTPRGGSESDFALARFLANGALDTSFGTNGRVQVDLAGASDDQGQEILILGGDRILIAGTSGGSPNDSDFALARFLADGTRDNNFGTAGIVITDIPAASAQANSPTLDNAFAAVALPDGRILVTGGTATLNPPSGGIALARYFENGTLDPSFGSGGIRLVETPLVAGSSPGALDLALAADGKLALVGSVAVLSQPIQTPMLAARLFEDGSPDPAFGSEGAVLLDIPIFTGGLDHLNAIALQPDGKIIGAGFAQTQSDGVNNIISLSVVRFLGDPAAQVEQPSEEVPNAPEAQNARAQLSLSGGGCTLALGNGPSEIIPWAFGMLLATLGFFSRRN